MTDNEFVRYATIRYIAEEAKKQGYRLGRTALVKLIYILQEKFNIPVGYDFSLYTYGPFAKEILDDLDYLSYLDVVNISRDGGGYNILPNDNSSTEYVFEKAQQFIADNHDQISDVVKKFGHLSAKNLELITTIHYVINDYKENKMDFTENNITELIHDIKPYFSKEEIYKKIDELKSNGFINELK